jgi:hypothetical protein
MEVARKMSLFKHAVNVVFSNETREKHKHRSEELEEILRDDLDYAFVSGLHKDGYYWSLQLRLSTLDDIPRLKHYFDLFDDSKWDVVKIEIDYRLED